MSTVVSTDSQRLWRRLLILFIGLFPLAAAPTIASPPLPTEPTVPKKTALPLEEFGYGISMAAIDADAVRDMGFNWIKVYDIPHKREPVNVLYRVDVNRWTYTNRTDFYWSFYDLVWQHKDKIDAYEIGNEPNLYVNGWEGPPDPVTYVRLVCDAANVIRNVDPTATIVSAGLAPVGRIEGSYGGYSGHKYVTQDEREFLSAFLRYGGGFCVDAIGYHPTGFSANYDAEPDINGGTPDTNCTNGFCFRGAEKIHEIITQSYSPDIPVWATEVGWIARPQDSFCLQDYSWVGRDWQQVTLDKQAENLVGAFTYARDNWPWMEAMFVFNYNFSQMPYYHDCEQMRYYAIQDTPAHLALTNLEKPQPPTFDLYLPVMLRQN